MSDDTNAEASDASTESPESPLPPAGGAGGGDARASEQPRTAVLPEPELPGAGTPEGDQLRRALMLYRLGNYAEMRAILTPLTTGKDPKIADAASALLRRIAVDPVQIGFLVGCLLAILAIAFHYLG
jgi:hypothetical protein